MNCQAANGPDVFVDIYDPLGFHLPVPKCDATMYHMKKANVRDLRYRFSEVEATLRAGTVIEITKRRRVIARLLPVRPSRRAARPDFLARLKKIYGSKILKVSGAELLARERGRF